MSTSAPRELKILVERVVRPLPLCLVRQKRLRADLLSHLEQIYNEELTVDFDEGAALARTVKRFGDPAELTVEFRKTIKWDARYEAWQERIFVQRPRESIEAYTLRMLAGFMCYVTTLLMLAVFARNQFRVGLFSFQDYRLVAGTLLFFLTWSGGFLWCGLHVGDARLHAKNWLMPTVLWSLGLCLIWPIGLVLLMSVSGGTWAEYSSTKISIPAMFGFGSVFSVLLGAFVGICHQRNMAYRREWSELEIDS